jgi:outer membrane protein OmpA-like peptidoglycan-associated protein/outer membrane protein W
MNRLFRRTVAATLAVGALAVFSSVASAGVEIGGTAGIHIFSTKNELGTPDSPTAITIRNSALFGLRLGYMFGNLIGVEVEGGVIPSESRSKIVDVWTAVYRAQVILQFRASNPDNKLVPFIVGGAGGTQLFKTDNADVLFKDTDFNAYGGVGAKYRVDNGWGLRFDARILFPPSTEKDKVTTDFEALLSVYKEFGREDKKETPPPPPSDPDGDGIVGDADKCPDKAEDKDTFQDDDGCPDLDNDGDGIPDTADKCPLEAEDPDGFQDDDGCPDLDNDADGIPDTSDKCVSEPEDKDGFQDDDGCPDLDNDGDGVPDTSDKCGDQPETKNGFQDDDGCPDEIPAKVQKFTGAIKGINFKPGSAEILASSNAVLDQAVAVLAEFKDVKVEVQGHTDDLAPKKGGKFADNQALSQARAESVKAYFLSKGIEDGRVIAKGFGDTVPVDPKKTAAARAKNRRWRKPAGPLARRFFCARRPPRHEGRGARGTTATKGARRWGKAPGRATPAPCPSIQSCSQCWCARSPSRSSSTCAPAKASPRAC